MKDLALVVVGALLSALLARTWGHRRLLKHVHEQIALLKDLPEHWAHQRHAVETLAGRDMARYIRQRNPSFPIHRLMGRLMDVAVIGIILVTFAQMGATPGSETSKQWVAIIGAAIILFAMAANIVVLLVRPSQVTDELNGSAQARVQDSRRR